MRSIDTHQLKTSQGVVQVELAPFHDLSVLNYITHILNSTDKN